MWVCPWYIWKMKKTHKFIHHLFCFPFLPEEQIHPIFALILAVHTPGIPIPHLLCPLFDYLLNIWEHSTIWPPPCWSVFNCSIGTNNDCEHWHKDCTKKSTDTTCHFTLLVNLFYRKASLMNMQAHLIADEKLKQVQCIKHKNQQRSSHCGKIML